MTMHNFSFFIWFSYIELIFEIDTNTYLEDDLKTHGCQWGSSHSVRQDRLCVWILKGCFQMEYLALVALCFCGYLSVSLVYLQAGMGTFQDLLVCTSVSVRKALWVVTSTWLSTQQKHQLFIVCAYWSSFEFLWLLIGACWYLMILMVTGWDSYMCMQVSVCEWLLALGCLANKSINCLLSAATLPLVGPCIPSTFYLQGARSSLEDKHINSLISFGSTGCLRRP